MTASENTTFSTSEEDVISRRIDVQADRTADNLSSSIEFEEFYEIERIAEEIVKGGFKRVALQFPDELLHDSVPIYRGLKARIGEGKNLYVLADTSYGSCCVDEVAAQHVDADAIVHYGHACMSQTYRIPVVYVFGKRTLDVEHCITQFVDALGVSSSDYADRKKALVFRHDVMYTNQADAIVSKLRQRLQTPVLYSKMPLRLDLPSSPPGHESPVADLPEEGCTILYVGGESLGLTNILMTHASSQVYSYDPETKIAQLQSSRTNKLLMRRYAVVQKARDADVFGILVGTLGVASYLPLISHIRTLLSQAHKKSYTISVGKLNPSKLANFMEIECFVLVACPENSLVDAKDFLRPIITPYELEVALMAEQSWTGRYVLKFESLLSQHAVHETSSNIEAVSAEDPERPTFSLVTGKYRQAKKFGGNTAQTEYSDPSAVVLRRQGDAVTKFSDSAAGQLLQERLYQGLETRVGHDAPSLLEQGRSGIARSYKDDHTSGNS